MTDLKTEELKYLATLQDYQIVFSTDEGQRVLQDLMQYGHMLSPSFSKDNSHETAFREGMRNIVLFILNRLDIDIKKLENQIRERSKR